MQDYQSIPELLHKLVHTLDRLADEILQKEYDISYKRAYFLYALQNLGPATQHQLASELGYSDASVSTMLAELSKDGYVVITPSPNHGRKNVVSLTRYGLVMVSKGRALLETRFNELMHRAAIDSQPYYEQTKQIYDAITEKHN